MSNDEQWAKWSYVVSLKDEGFLISLLLDSTKWDDKTHELAFYDGFVSFRQKYSEDKYRRGYCVIAVQWFSTTDLK